MYEIYGIIFSESKCLELPHRALWVFKGPFAFSRYRGQSPQTLCNTHDALGKGGAKPGIGWNFYRGIYKRKNFLKIFHLKT